MLFPRRSLMRIICGESSLTCRHLLHSRLSETILFYDEPRFCRAIEYCEDIISILERESLIARSGFIYVSATYLDPGGFGDSRQCLKEGESTPQTPITGNHLLDVPRSLDPNPNLLSPEILTQRRGWS